MPDRKLPVPLLVVGMLVIAVLVFVFGGGATSDEAEVGSVSDRSDEVEQSDGAEGVDEVTPTTVEPADDEPAVDPPAGEASDDEGAIDGDFDSDEGDVDGSFDDDENEEGDRDDAPFRYSDLPTITLDELPSEALDTLEAIESGGPYPYRQDDGTFQNREGILPDREVGHYREYTVDTPGSSDRGARRIVAGADGERYWTDDHYASFAEIVF